MSKSFSFDVAKQSNSIIKVLGIGGGGSNAVSHMFDQGIKDVEFVICNTDLQALQASHVPSKVQLGVNLTEGLGAGANPEKGREAAMESKEEIREILGSNTKMVFITAGMGGGTGTGAAPVIAKVAKDLDILTVGIVTVPFLFEGKKKKENAEAGIHEMKKYCDTVLVILNDRLREIYGDLKIREAFAHADNVLTNAAKSIAEIITVTSDVNVDFQDVKTVMKGSGAAVMGSASTNGEGRAIRAAEEALSSPLLNNTSIHGAKQILLSIRFGEEAELSMDELTEITDFIQSEAGEDADLIFGQGLDPILGDQLCVTVIATGFLENSQPPEPIRTVIDMDSGAVLKEEAPMVAEDEQQDTDEKKVFELEVDEKPEPEEKELVNPESSKTQKGFRFEKNEEEKVEENDYRGINPSNSGNRLREEAEKRKSALRGETNISPNSLDPEEFKDHLERPAYERKQLMFFQIPDHSKNEMSRYKLNDDNELLGDNKFLHDNVD
jgi:cell division protein FtsZ